MSSQRRTVIFSGRVQGVGFRMTAARLGASRAVSGTVRNLPDGTVELVVEGLAGPADDLIDALREHFDADVRMVDQSPALPGRTGRGIRIID